MAPLAHMDEALETALEQGGRWMVAPLAHEAAQEPRKRVVPLAHEMAPEEEFSSLEVSARYGVVPTSLSEVDRLKTSTFPRRRPSSRGHVRRRNDCRHSGVQSVTRRGSGSIGIVSPTLAPRR